MPSCKLIACALLLCSWTGCGWIARLPQRPLLGWCHRVFDDCGGQGDNLRQAQRSLVKAEFSLATGQDDCVDHYFHAASLAWNQLATSGNEPGDCSPVATEIYHGALRALITQGQRFGRIDARLGLRVCTADGELLVPLLRDVNSPSLAEIDQFIMVDEQRSRHLNHYYRRPGLGMTAVAVRYRGQGDRFLPPRQLMATTIVLRSDIDSQQPAGHRMVLELHDPLQSNLVEAGDRIYPLAADYSAPFKVALDNTSGREILRSFLQPGQTRPDESGLFFLERYQPGKVPVVFVHGLLSDRYTWANVANEFRAQQDLLDHYQLLSYQYPTGESFLQSAARLRAELQQFRDVVDPSHCDPALDRIVLVGHSMGGLISKLQVTSSGDALWRAIASRPLPEISLDPSDRAALAETFYFTSSPAVSRVVFIGTPHRGSAYAQRAVGRLGGLLVRVPDETRERHLRMLQANPGVFSGEVSRRYPTSIDLLNPGSSLLQAISCLAIDPHVQYHSIIGRGSWMVANGDSDGVVPVDSARIAGAASELTLRCKHTELTHDLRVIAELIQILRIHALKDLTDLRVATSVGGDMEATDCRSH
jgi:pimeloyl-ACP methyl ester carboxylesterase